MKTNRQETGGGKSPLRHTTRRGFLAASAATAAMACFTPRSVFAAGSDKIRIGLIGCGCRGTGAAVNCIESSKGVEIVAMGDVFKDRIDTSRVELQKNVPAEAYRVTDDKCFIGFDAYQHVINSDVDVVLLTTPAHFRSIHLKAAIEAGKHAFIEKPVAVDPVGARSIIASSELAAQKNLAIVAGTQRRHDTRYRDIIGRIHDGAIGELVGAQCYWLRGGLWIRERQPEWSDMEWQLRNFIYFTWLGGDCIVDLVMHNLDIVNWAFGGPPVSAMAVGGRQIHETPKHGNVFDHFGCEFVYNKDVRTLTMVREWTACEERMGEKIVGTKGVAYVDRGIIEGENPYHSKATSVPYVQEHADLIQSIRDGKPLNEGRTVAETNLTCIMGRESGYTGKQVTWDWILNQSKLDLSPAKYELGPFPLPPVARPGLTPLI
jgi:myo-inositol 2-dehydrogenase / D-chiro-inositol 1-dehydrogenase